MQFIFSILGLMIGSMSLGAGTVWAHDAESLVDQYGSADRARMAEEECLKPILVLDRIDCLEELHDWWHHFGRKYLDFDEARTQLEFVRIRRKQLSMDATDLVTIHGLVSDLYSLQVNEHIQGLRTTLDSAIMDSYTQVENLNRENLDFYIQLMTAAKLVVQSPFSDFNTKVIYFREWNRLTNRASEILESGKMPGISEEEAAQAKRSVTVHFQAINLLMEQYALIIP